MYIPATSRWVILLQKSEDLLKSKTMEHDSVAVNMSRTNAIVVYGLYSIPIQSTNDLRSQAG